MGQQSCFSKHQFAHRLEIMQCGTETEPTQGLSHLGKDKLRLVAEREKSFRATECLTRFRDRENFVGRHGVSARITGIAAEGAVSAVVSAQVSQRNKDLARIGDDARLEAVTELPGSGKKLGQMMVGTANPTAGILAGQWSSFVEVTNRRRRITRTGQTQCFCR